MKRKRWLFFLLLLPLALAIPLYSVASWRPHAVGVHPFRAAATVPKAPQHLAPTYGLMMSPDGTHLISFTYGGQNMEPRGVAMWNLQSGRVLWKKQQRNYRGWVPLCFSPDGKSVALNHRSQLGSKVKPETNVIICDSATGKPLAELPAFITVSKAAFSRDGQQITLVTQHDILVWSVAMSREIARLKVKPDDLSAQIFAAFTLTPDGQKFLVNWVSQRKLPFVPLRAELHDLDNKKYWEAPGQWLGQTLFSPDGRWLLRRDIESPQFEMRDATTGVLKWKRAVNDSRMMPIEGIWLPDSSGVVVVHYHKFLLLDARTGKVVKSVAKFPQVGDNFAISPDGNEIYAISDYTASGAVGIGGQIMRQRLR